MSATARTAKRFRQGSRVPFGLGDGAFTDVPRRRTPPAREGPPGRPEGRCRSPVAAATVRGEHAPLPLDSLRAGPARTEATVCGSKPEQGLGCSDPDRQSSSPDAGSRSASASPAITWAALIPWPPVRSCGRPGRRRTGP
ncbi:hypothetical protein SAM23877_7201 [Streptomyces ambofaciens ATCC 23877]|uniref:Uncharacterized protein n=1 Tax=Streptomyces ambofaciens (strain ATCC 23877 / 3486 / DSM 40053 / JCM 4204 / NBRC 12836 / NRRL B-2516) TaxID=278992 RepID=A0A0K2B4N7_STRA7|nr:hypothetical protein SAM23877_7201 [Streptomyces ambofaciens ATCC 23877]